MYSMYSHSCWYHLSVVALLSLIFNNFRSFLAVVLLCVGGGRSIVLSLNEYNGLFDRECYLMSATVDVFSVLRAAFFAVLFPSCRA